MDLLKIIQLGLTFFNADGEMPEGVCTWQVSIIMSSSPCFKNSFLMITLATAVFIPTVPTNDFFQFNFKFNLSEDMYAEDSVELLQNSGIQFDRHEREVSFEKRDSELMKEFSRELRRFTLRRCCWFLAQFFWMMSGNTDGHFYCKKSFFLFSSN